MSDLETNRGSVSSGSVTNTGFSFSNSIGNNYNRSVSLSNGRHTINKQDVIDFDIELSEVEDTTTYKDSLLAKGRGPINPNFLKDYLSSVERKQKKEELLKNGYQPEDVDRILSGEIKPDKLDEEIYQEYCNGNNKRYKAKIEARVINYMYFNREEFEKSLKTYETMLEDLEKRYKEQSEYYQNEVKNYSSILEEAVYDQTKERYIYTDKDGNVLEFTAEEYEGLKKSLTYFKQKNNELIENYNVQKETIDNAIEYLTSSLEDQNKPDFTYKSVAEIDSEIAELKYAETKLKDSIYESEYDTLPSAEVTTARLEEKKINEWFGVRNENIQISGLTCIKVNNDKYIVMESPKKQYKEYDSVEELVAAGFYIAPDHGFYKEKWDSIKAECEEYDAKIKKLETKKAEIESIMRYPLEYDKYLLQDDFEENSRLIPIQEKIDNVDLHDVDTWMSFTIGGYYDVLADGKVRANAYLNEPEYIVCNRLKNWDNAGVIDEYDPNIKKIYAYRYNKGDTAGADAFLESYFPVFDDMYVKKQMANDAAYAVSDPNLLGLKDVGTLVTNIYYSWAGLRNSNVLRTSGKKVYNSDIYNPATTIHSAISNRYYQYNSVYGDAMQVIYSLDQQAINLLLIYLMGGGGSAGAGASAGGSIISNSGASLTGSSFSNILSNISVSPEALLSSTIVYGVPSFNNTYFDAKYNRRLDDNQAYLLALFTASTEVATESLATCHLLGLDSACQNVLNSGIINSKFAAKLASLTHMSPSTASKVLAIGYTMITQGTFEFSEEYETTCLDYLWDQLITGNESNINIKIENYKKLNPGCSDFDAVANALLEVNKEAVEAGEMGFVCGFLTAGAMGTSYSDISNPLGVDYVVNPNVQINTDVQVDQQVVENTEIESTHITQDAEIQANQEVNSDNNIEIESLEKFNEVIDEETEVDTDEEEAAFFNRKSSEEKQGFLRRNFPVTQQNVQNSNLTPQEQAYVNRINAEIKSGNNVRITVNNTTQISTKVLRSISDLSKVQVVIKGGFNDLNGNFRVKYNKPKYINRVTYTGYEALAISQKLDTLSAQVDMSLPPKERARQIYDILRTQIPVRHDYQAYETNRQYMNVFQSLRGLTDTNDFGKAGLICAGFAQSYKEMCTRAGLTCDYIRGLAYSDILRQGKSGGHAWNVVVIDANTYIPVDVTWGATQDGWFGGSDAFQARHIADPDESFHNFSAPKIVRSTDSIKIDAVVNIMTNKYGSKQIALQRLYEYISPRSSNYGEIRLFTSTGGARTMMEGISMESIRQYLKEVNWP